jgi:hypothetical protein
MGRHFSSDHFLLVLDLISPLERLAQTDLHIRFLGE